MLVSYKTLAQRTGFFQLSILSRVRRQRACATKLSDCNSLYLIYFPAATKQHGFDAHQYDFVRKLTPS